METISANWMEAIAQDLDLDMHEKSKKYSFDFVKEVPRITANSKFMWLRDQKSSKHNTYKRSSTWSTHEKEEKLLKTSSASSIKIQIY